MKSSTGFLRTARLSALLMLGLAVLVPAGRASAQEAPIGLGTADNFAVLAGQGVTNTGPTTVNGDLGTWPNPAVTGAGLTVNGSVHAADAVARQAQADTTVAYNEAAGRTPTTVATELGGQVLTPGVYNSSSGAFEITGPLTLNAEGDPNAVFVLQTTSTLVTASASSVNVINAGSACNVFWKVGSSATLGTSSTFRGTILALESITVTTGVTIEGRTLARNGAVTLNTDTITRSSCTTPEATSTTLTSSANPSEVDEPVSFVATVTSAGGTAPTGSVTFLDDGAPIGTVALDSNGQATLTTSKLGAGSHSITAVYLGGGGFDSSTSAPVAQGVNEPPSTTPAPTPVNQDDRSTTASPPDGTNSTATGTSRPTLPSTGAAVDATAGTGLLVFLLGMLVLHASRRTAPERVSR